MDFQIEFQEYITMKYINKLEIGQTKGTTTYVNIQTLEGLDLTLECDIYSGIKVIQKNKTFENMEQILGEYSPLYKEKFSNDLISKLLILQQEQNEVQ